MVGAEVEAVEAVAPGWVKAPVAVAVAAPELVWDPVEAEVVASAKVLVLVMESVQASASAWELAPGAGSSPARRRPQHRSGLRSPA